MVAHLEGWPYSFHVPELEDDNVLGPSPLRLVTKFGMRWVRTGQRVAIIPLVAFRILKVWQGESDPWRVQSKAVRNLEYMYRRFPDSEQSVRGE